MGASATWFPGIQQVRFGQVLLTPSYFKEKKIHTCCSFLSFASCEEDLEFPLAHVFSMSSFLFVQLGFFIVHPAPPKLSIYIYIYPCD